MAAVHLLDVHIRIGLLLPIGKQEAQTGTYRFCHWLFGVAGHMDIYARKRDNVRRSDAGRLVYADLGAASEAFGQGASRSGSSDEHSAVYNNTKREQRLSGLWRLEYS